MNRGIGPWAADGVGSGGSRVWCDRGEECAMPGSTVVRGSGEGTAYWMLGGLYVVRVAASEPGGAVTIMEMTMPAGMGPPPHTHPGGESVHVLEGRIRYHIDGES